MGKRSVKAVADDLEGVLAVIAARTPAKLVPEPWARRQLLKAADRGYATPDDLVMAAKRSIPDSKDRRGYPKLRQAVLDELHRRGLVEVRAPYLDADGYMVPGYTKIVLPAK